jgi:hypothetical protein
MKNKFTRILLSLVLIAQLVATVVVAVPVAAVDPYTTTSVRIVKYAADQTTILDEETVTYQWMEANLPIQGDGTTHYWTQGPTFVPTNLWDPAETLNLKDKGALKGTNLKDLCELVGGMRPNDTVTAIASDNYGNDIFPYTNVYTPDPRQGNMTICWYNGATYDEGGNPITPGYVPAYSNGMLLAFFAQTTNADGKLVFGHQDMKDLFPSAAYHWYVDGAIRYPSTNGAYYKYISEIRIYTDGQTNWSVLTSGAREEAVTVSKFGNCLSCHAEPPATMTDGEGNAYSGLPLWWLMGAVDDTTNLHGPGAFNDNLYYDVKVTGSGGYSYTFASTAIARNDDYILANQWKPVGTTEFVTLPPDKFPLKLVNHEFTVGGPSVANINTIELKNISVNPPTYPPVTAVPAEWPLKLYGAQADTLTQAAFDGCLGCHQHTYTDGASVWTGLPLWYLMGVADDTKAHGAGDFNDALATTGYDVVAIGADTYSYTFGSALLANNDNVIVANKLNGTALPVDDGGSPSHPLYPLKIVGPLEGTGWKIGSLVRIDLRNIPPEAPAWDLNTDHICNIGDVVRIGLKWGQTGAPGWLPEDLSPDGSINIGDVVVLGLNWGKSW